MNGNFLKWLWKLNTSMFPFRDMDYILCWIHHLNLKNNMWRKDNSANSIVLIILWRIKIFTFCRTNCVSKRFYMRGKLANGLGLIWWIKVIGLFGASLALSSSSVNEEGSGDEINSAVPWRARFILFINKVWQKYCSCRVNCSSNGSLCFYGLISSRWSVRLTQPCRWRYLWR